MTKRIGIGMGCLTILVLVIGLGMAYRQWHHHHCIQITREWARLEPLPASARNVKVEVTGNMFTRGFVVSFTAPRGDIDTWLRASPGTASVIPEYPSTPSVRVDRTLPAGVRVYRIKPGGGAMFAEVTVQDASGVVKIRLLELRQREFLLGFDL